MAQLLTHWTESLGKDQAQSANTMFVFVGRGGVDTPVHYMWWLLVDARYSPKVQVCSKVDVPEGFRSRAAPLEFPFKAVVASGPPRMERLDTKLEDISFATSDEICLLAAQYDCAWELRRVKFEWDDGPNLLRLWVMGVSDAFVARVAEKKSVSADNMKIILGRDPWDVGDPAAAAEAMDFGLAAPIVYESDSDSVLDGVQGDPIAESDLEVDVGGLGGDADPDPGPLECP